MTRLFSDLSVEGNKGSYKILSELGAGCKRAKGN